MNTENKENDINDSAITLEVDSEVIDRVRKGEIKVIRLDINEGNQERYLETVNGHLILCTEELPDTYFGCYFYNNGEFPYIMKKALNFLILSDGENSCLTQIIGKDAVPGTRFRFQGPDEPSVEDPEGDCCVWEANFEILPVPEKPKRYLMRWNPTISSFKEEDYKMCVENARDEKFRIDWSIFEWEEANIGDMFYMMRVGDDKAGIVFNGYFLTEPYTGDDWAGSTKRRCYVDLLCQNAVAPEEKPIISLKRLKEAIPNYNWEKGHSGELLPEDVITKLDLLWEAIEEI